MSEAITYCCLLTSEVQL